MNSSNKHLGQSLSMAVLFVLMSIGIIGVVSLF